MFSFGMSEILIMAVVAIIFIPAHKIPQVMRSAGRFFGSLRQYHTEFRRMIHHSEAWQDELKIKQSHVNKVFQDQYDDLKRSVYHVDDSSSSSLSSHATTHSDSEST